MNEQSKPKWAKSPYVWFPDMEKPKQPKNTIGLYVECGMLWAMDLWRYKTCPAFGVYLTYQQVEEMTDSAELQDYVINAEGFAENLTDAQYQKMIKATPDKFLRDECFDRGIEVRPFDKED